MSVVDLTKTVIFDKSIILSNSEGLEQYETGIAGQIRFNQTSLKFEGFNCYPNSNNGADVLGNKWRPLTYDIASTSNLGICRIGTNLIIDRLTGTVSSLIEGVSRLYQLIITVSPILGAGEYQSINDAISDAIGTPAKNYIDGTLTSIIGSPPSANYPFILLISPGNYSEPTNTIVLPDYVSLMGDSYNNPVIIQNGGNTNLSKGSLINVGQNSLIKNISFVLASTTSSKFYNAIYSLNKSNVVIDNCTIKCSETINSNLQTQTNGIYMNGGNNNRIINNILNFNTSTLLGSLNAIYITNSIPELQNNTIDILSPRTIITNGIYLNNCIGTDSELESESIHTKLYIDNLKVSNNYYNPLNSTNINTGITITNTPLILKNSYIEVSNSPHLSTNYGINFNSNTSIQKQPYIGQITSNIISFINTNAGVNSILSSNIAILNFLTQHYERGQYISVSGSSLNNGIYKIASRPTSNIILLDNGYTLMNENQTSNNTIILKSLYDINIFNTKINGSTHAIQNSTLTNNYICNLDNVINDGGPYNISPSYVYYSNYKTITVGRINCDYTTLYHAMNSINDNTSNTRYLIKIQSGIYQETTYIQCKEYVDIEGNGKDNTILQFSQSGTNIIQPTINSSCFRLCSNMSIKNLIINNNGQISTSFSQSISIGLLFPLSLLETYANVTLENITITINFNTYVIHGLLLQNCDTIVLRNVDINIHSSSTSAIESNGMFNNNCSNVSLLTTSILVNSINCIKNTSIYLKDSECNIYNSFLTTYAGQTNSGIYTQNTTNTNTDTHIQKLVQVYNGQIRAYDNLDYSIYADNYYTIMCNGVQLLSNTYTNSISSRIYCHSCYTFTNENDKYNIQSLNSRGQNEQSQNTITIGNSAGKLNSSGSDNVFIGVNTGSNVTTASYNTFLGSNTGSNTQISNNNTLIGSYVGNVLTTGLQNTIVGSNSGMSMTTGSNNIISGYNIGSLITNGNNNILMGANAGKLVSNGNLNVFIGTSSGLNTTLSKHNTFIGNYSGISNQIGNGNTYLGYNTGNTSISGSNTILIGKEAGYNNLNSNIVAIGNQAGYHNNNNDNTNAIKNTYIGYNSGYNNTTGLSNTYFGYKSGYSNTSASAPGVPSFPSSASFNITIGNEAGYSLTSGIRNILIGAGPSQNTNDSNDSNDSAGRSLQNGADNIYIGSNSGSQSISSINNVLIGSNVGASIINASNNVLIGKNTGNLINTKGDNIIIGADSGNSNNYGSAFIIGQNSGINYTGNVAFVLGHNAGNNSAGAFNMYIGQNTGGSSLGPKTGRYNLSIGSYAGYVLSSGNNNVIIGSGNELNSTGSNITSGNDNTLLGYLSGKSLQSGSYNTLLGSNAGPTLLSGIENLILGKNSAYNLSTGNQNVSLGTESGYSLTTSNGNIFTGYQAGFNTTSGSNNINIGYQAGYTGQTSINNIHIGYHAGYYSNSNAIYNLCLGSNAGIQNTSGQNNIFLGSNTGYGNNILQEQIGNNNMFMGTNAGTSNYNGTTNIFLGLNAGINNLNGSKNVFIGENTGSNTNLTQNIFIGSTSIKNVGVGSECINSNIDIPYEGTKNVFIGHNVGIKNTTGYDNILIGDSAGENNTTGIHNIYIGTNAGNKGTDQGPSDNPTAIVRANYNIAVGYYAGVNNIIGEDNILIGKNVASATLVGNSYYKNIIIGSEAGQHINQNNQIFIGTKAGEHNTTGDRNIFIGLNAGKTNTISCDNVMIGSNAGAAFLGNETLGQNILLGNQSGERLETGINNIYIGSGSGKSSVSSINNVLIGINAMSNGDANNVVMIGNTAGQNNNADENVFIGLNAGKSNTISTNNVIIGSNAGILLTGSGTTGNNLLIGSFAGEKVETGINNIYIGSQTAQNASTGINNIAIGSYTINEGNANNIIMLGSNAGFKNRGDKNIFIGLNAGRSNINSLDNVVIGSDAGVSLIGNGTVGNNILLGFNSGNSLETGINNIYIGTNSGKSSTTSINNVVMGVNAMSNGNANNVVILGSNAGFNNNANENVFIGLNAGKSNMTSPNNIFIGSNSGVAVIGNGIDGDNILIGNKSGEYLETGVNNIYIGSGSGTNSISSMNNIVIGAFAMNEGNASNQVIIGTNAGLNNNSDGNIFIGSNAGINNITGKFNICIGLNTGYENVNSPNNVIIGVNAGSSLIGDGLSGGDNILIGSNAGQSLITGKNNIYVGSGSGSTATTSNNNVVIGSNTLREGNSNQIITIGNNAGLNNNADGNIFIGSNVGVNNTTGINNIFMGLNAGKSNTISTDNVMIGSNTGCSFIGNTIGNNVFIGDNAGKSLIRSTNNINIGSGAGANASTSNNNVVIGTNAMYNGNANDVIIIGSNAGLNNNAEHNIFIGTNTGKLNTISTDNILIGSNVGVSLIGNGIIGNNLLIGSNAGHSLETGINNIYIGSGAGKNATTTINNIVIGKNAMHHTNVNEVIMIGTNAGFNNNIEGNIFIGSNAGVSTTIGGRNVCIGLNAGKSNMTSTDNVIIGSNAGISLIGSSSGTTNTIGKTILIGNNAGKYLESCSNNIFIGANTGSNATTSINNVILGANVMKTGNANDVVILGNNTGVNNNADGNIFIGSNIAVHNINGEGNIVIGYKSGYNVNSNGNIIFGHQSISTGQIGDNTIIIGHEIAKYVNNKSFANNIIMGASAGQSSNLSIHSIVIGANALKTGTGGESNLIMGHNSAQRLGNPHPYYALTTSNITTSINDVYINIPFGTGGYYFRNDDFIIIEAQSPNTINNTINNTTSNYILQTQITSVLPGTGNYSNTTQIIFISKPTQFIPIGSVVYVKNVNVEPLENTGNATGTTSNIINTKDYSKSSSNMCIGNNNSFELTTGNKNTSLGDNAMYNNEVGSNNIICGTDSGYNLNTNNNVCLGTQAGYSLDKYKDTQLFTDLIFNSNTNTISSKNYDFSKYSADTVFDIIGSSSNDDRYTIKSVNNNIDIDNNNSITSNITVISDTYIYDNNIIPLGEKDLVISSNSFSFSNNTFLCSNVNINYQNNYMKIIFDTSDDANNFYKYRGLYFTIKNSKFNDGIKIANIFWGNGFQIDNNSVYINTLNPLYTENSNNVYPITILLNNIQITSLTSYNTDTITFNQILGNETFFIENGINSGMYTVVSDYPYFIETFGNFQPHSLSTIVNNPYINSANSFTKIYIKGNKSVVLIVSNILNDNRIQNVFALTEVCYFEDKYIYDFPSFNGPPCLIKILNYGYSNYYYINSIVTINNNNTAYIDTTFNTLYIPEPNSTRPSQSIQVCEIQNASLFTELFTSSNQFNGSIVNIRYNNNENYRNDAFGAYIVEVFYKGNLALNKNLLQFSNNTQKELNININHTSFKALTVNDYTSSYDLIFQTSNISYNNISLSNTKSLGYTGLTGSYSPNATNSFTVVGGQDINSIAYSSNGLTYNKNTNNYNIFDNGICNTIVWNGIIWVAGGSGSNPLAYSFDGVNWIHSKNGNVVFANSIVNSVEWSSIDNKWLACGSGTNNLAYSYDGMEWVNININILNYKLNYNASELIVGPSSSNAFINFTSSRSGNRLVVSSLTILGRPGSFQVVSTYVWDTILNSWNLIDTTTITGSSLALNSDASILVVGYIYGGINYSGLIRTYQWNTITNTWDSILTGTVIFSTLVNYSFFGSSVALSDDGSTLSVGASLYLGVGGVFTYSWNNGLQQWDRLYSGDITGPYYGPNNQTLGSSVALNNNATILVAGSYQGNGFVFTYNWDYSEDTWVNIISANIVPPNFVYGFGSGVSLNNNGTLLAVSQSAVQGGIYLYTYDNTANSWTPIKYYLYVTLNNISVSISLSGTGQKLLRCLPNYNSNGAIFTYTINEAPINLNTIKYINTINNNNVNTTINNWIVGGEYNSNDYIRNLLYSTDTLTWNYCTIVNVSNITINTISYNSNIILAGGASTNEIIYSTDSINWYAVNNNTIFSNNICNTLSWNGTIWVAGGEGNVPISYSNDGMTWTGSSTSGSLFTDNICNSIDWNGTYFIAGGKGDNPIGYSSNGILWMQNPINNYNQFFPLFDSNNCLIVSTHKNSIIPGPNNNTCNGYPLFTVGGGVGSNVALSYSNDGLVWVPSNSNNSVFNQCNGIAYNGSIWVAVGNDSTNQIVYSRDGINWTPSNNGNSLFYGCKSVACNANMWVVGGFSIINNTLGYSTDGINWTLSNNSIMTSVCNSIVWNGSIWVAGGVGTNSLAYSFNGIDWSLSNNGNAIMDAVLDIAWNGSIFLSCGIGNNKLSYSYDGINWIASHNGNSIFGGECFSLAWNGSIWVAGGVNHTIQTSLAYSYDGINWTPSNNGNYMFKDCSSITWNGLVFIASAFYTDNLNILAFSSDGINWSAIDNNNCVLLSYNAIASTKILPNIELNNAIINTSTHTSNTAIITSSVDYDFVDIIAPTLIKLEDTTGNLNDGFYLVTENKRPYNKLIIQGEFAIPQSNISNVTIKTKSISSYYGLVDLSQLQLNTEYTTFGSNYNHNTNFRIHPPLPPLSPPPPPSLSITSNITITAQSIYLSDDTTIVNDSYNKFEFILPLLSEGQFQHIDFNTISIVIISGTSIRIDASSNVGLQSNLSTIIANSYLKILNTSSLNDYTGLYCINSIVNTSNVYTIIVNSKYERNGIIYTTPAPFYNSSYPTILNNCNLLSNQFICNADANMFINYYGENTKFLSFSNPSPFGQLPLTFENESYNLNISNVSISLLELCPNNASSSYSVSFGVPAPKSRPSTSPSNSNSNTHRKMNRPLMYSTKQLYLSGDIHLSTSTNSISIVSYTQYDYQSNIYYGKHFENYNFEMFRPGQMIYFQTSNNSGAHIINTISNDYTTLYLDDTFNIVRNEIASNITIDMKYILNNETINFGEFGYNLTTPSSPIPLSISVYKYPLIENTPVNFSTTQLENGNKSNLLFNTSFVKPADLQEFCMNHTLIIPTNNIAFNYTNISFHNLTKTGESDLSFNASPNSITSVTTDLSGFKTSEYILISNTTNNNYLYRINNTIAPTATSIIISSDYQLIDETNTSALLRANNINTSNSSATDLSLFYGGQKLIISNTTYNNNTYTINSNSNAKYSIFINSPNVVTETPDYCTIEKSIIIDEQSIISATANDISFNPDHYIASQTTDLSGFRTGQTVSITNTSLNNTTYTISSNVIPTYNSIKFNEPNNYEQNTGAILSKNINFNIIGEPTQIIQDTGLIVPYITNDYEGNNCMIGSFAGQYTGSLNTAIYNVALGSRCAQVNHGSGNIFIGNETIIATSNTQVEATTYNNKFAIYKTNTIGISSKPLLAGDFETGRVGINTINPEAFSIPSDVVETDTKLVVNGGVLANAYSPFTGCHLIYFTNSNEPSMPSTPSIPSNIKVGMIVSTTGKVLKASSINTYCTVQLSKVQNDKKVLGIYAFSEQNKSSKENEYIIDDNGKYIKNPYYTNDNTNDTTTLHYAAAVGEGCIFVSNYGGEIQNGDYITSSPIAGYGSLQSDSIKHSYTVAKCTETIDWSSLQPTIAYNSNMYKVCLVACVYHCG